MTDRDPDLHDTAGKPAKDDHPDLSGQPANLSDYADPRVAQPGDDPPGEDVLGGQPPPEPPAPSGG